MSAERAADRVSLPAVTGNWRPASEKQHLGNGDHMRGFVAWPEGTNEERVTFLNTGVAAEQPETARVAGHHHLKA